MIMYLTILPNRAELHTKGSASVVELVAREPWEELESSQLEQKKYACSRLNTRLRLGSSSQEAVHKTAENKQPTTKKCSSLKTAQA